MRISRMTFCMLVLAAGLTALAAAFADDKPDQNTAEKRAAILKELGAVKAKAQTAQSDLDKLKASQAKLQQELDRIDKQAREKAEALAKEAEAIKVQAVEAQKALDDVRETVKGKTQQITREKAAVAKSQTGVTAAEKQLKPQQEAVKKATEGKTAAEEALEAAKKALADAQAKAQAADKAVADAQATLKKTTDAIASGKAAIAQSNETIKKSEQEIKGLVPQLEKAREQYASLSSQVLAKRKESERVLATIGKFVSFSEEVAPVISRRCLACHNARTAKGRYNMETFAALMKGGESGAAVEPGDGDLSTLYIMVEDGSMPKDADPLTKEELAAIKNWINAGAKLDAGFSPGDSLVGIAPKLPQPSPPESYRVPIPVTAVAFNPDGKTLASSGYHEVILWNAADGKQLRRITNVAERVYDIEFSSDGGTLVVAAGTPGQLGEVKLFNVADGKVLADLVTSDDSVFAVSFSPDGKRLATAGADRAIRVFDLESRKLLGLIEDHADWVMDVAWTPDGTKLASASRDKTSKVFDMSPAKDSLTGLLDPNSVTGDSLVTFNGHGEPVFGVSFTPDGKQVVTSGSDKQIRIWNVSDAKQTRNIGGFGNEVFRIQVTKDGQVYSCSADKNARLHNLADGKAIRTFSGHADWVYSVAYHPETKKVATGSYDGQVRIWNAEDGKGLVTFTAAPGYKPPEATASANK